MLTIHRSDNLIHRIRITFFQKYDNDLMMMMTVANRDPEIRPSTNASNATLYVPPEVTYGSGFATS
jgi:hypothetical protein